MCIYLNLLEKIKKLLGIDRSKKLKTIIFYSLSLFVQLVNVI